METPVITNIKDDSDVLEFEVHHSNVSIINSMRRCILSEIPIYVFKGFPHEKSEINIIKNNTRLHNEIIKQRLGCIPVFIKPGKEIFDITKYKFVIDKSNLTNETVYITTGDIEIYNIEDTNKKISKKVRDKIFPKNEITGNYIIIGRLRPRVSPDIEPETLQVEMKLSIGNAKEDGMFNAVSTCSYYNLIDESRVERAREEYSNKVRNFTNDEKTYEREMKNWEVHDKNRIIHPDKYSMKIETLGIYTNTEIWNKSCDIMIDKLNKIIEECDKETLTMEYQLGTTHSFYIRLENEDYTLGKVLEYMIYTMEYVNKTNTNNCLLVNFFKKHPLNSYGILRIDFIKNGDNIEDIKKYRDTIYEILKKGSEELKKLYTTMKM